MINDQSMTVPLASPSDPQLFVVPQLSDPQLLRASRSNKSNKSNVSEADSEDSKALRLRLKGTFIDFGDDEGQDLSPRPVSDPGSEVSSGYTHSSYFAKERTYVAGLSQK